MELNLADIVDNRYQIFDRVAKRTLALSSSTVILLVNALFGENYPSDSTVEYLSTEHITDTLNRWASDILIRVNHAETYHIEVQLADDEAMGLRVFNYDYLDAVKNQTADKGNVNLPFARSIVLYLESTAHTPDELSVTLSFSDKSVHPFRVRTFKLLDYSVVELEERKMSALLPLYLLKLRRRISGARTSSRRRELAVPLKNLVEESLQTIYRSERNGLMSKSDMRTVLGLMGMVYGYLYKPYPEFKELNMMMDDVFLTVVDEAELAGQTIGRAEGKAEGMAAGRAEGKAEGKTESRREIAQELIKEGWTIEKIARTTRLDLGTVESLYQSIHL